MRGGVLARERPIEEKEARKLYEKGMKLKDIAQKLGKAEGTIRRWKHDYEWESEQSERSEKKANVRNEKKNQKKEPAVEEIEAVIENDDLTDKQRLFCVLYVRSFNATKAYLKAYDCSYNTAAVNGHKLLKNAKIVDQIKSLKQGRLNRELISEEDIVQMYIDILYADINDYMHGNMIDLRNPLADGRLIKKVSFGKQDSIELLDKMKALQWLSDHMDLATEKQKAEIEILKAKAAKEDPEQEEVEDDGFLEALNGSAQEDWSDEEE